MSRSVLLGILLALASACSSETEGVLEASSSAEVSKGPTARPVAPPPVLRESADPNPLELPAKKLELENGARVFAVPEPMLRGAKLGSSMQLRAATVVGKDGDNNLMIDGRDGPDYPIHPSYVIVLDSERRPRVNQPVVVEWAKSIRHGVVRRYVKDKIVVRFTDTQDKSDRQVLPTQLMSQKDGFRPGNYAALRGNDGELEHVLLVSPLTGEPKDATEWFAIGYLGSARIAKTEALVGVPVSLSPKAGATVLVEHLGRMRDAVVKEVDAPGLMTVRFERAGRSVQTGWGLVMLPLGGG